MRKFFPIMILLLTMTGCNAPIAVETSEVVGTWVMREESREYLPPEVEESTGKITISADGTFVAHELPERKRYWGSRGHMDRWMAVSGSGNWEFIYISGLQYVHLGFNKRSVDNADEQDVSYGFPINIKRWRSTIDMYYNLSDPDLWERVYFEKITQ